jgi:hypothetical protein
MARWQITIIDPLNVVPPLVLVNIAGGYSRSIIQQIGLAELTAAGNPILQGTARPGDRYIWEMQAQLLEADKLHLEALIDEQQDRFSRLQDGHLLWIDEVEYLPPKPLARQKPLLSGSAVSVHGKITGFPIVPVIFAIQQTPQHVGVSADGYHKLTEFTVTEIPG